MDEQRLRILKLSALSIAVAALFGCGGSNDSPSALGTTAQESSVQMTETASAMRVSASSSDDAESDSVVMLQRQYAFAATLTSGRALAGTLMLKGEEEHGLTKVEGTFIQNAATATAAPSATPPSPDAVAQAAALRDQLKAGLASLRSAYRSDIADLAQTLRAALKDGAAATGDHKAWTPAQQVAMQAFKDTFASRTAQYQSDAAALTLDIQNQMTALGVEASSDGSKRGDADKDETKPSKYEVKGTISADGKVDLVLKGKKGTSIQLVGTIAADGSLAGTMTGPAAGDQGTWAASAGAMPPPPPPSAANGKVLYNLAPAGALACSVCHTPMPANNVSNVLKGANNPGLISSAITGNKGGMGIISGKFTAAELADIAAYLGQPNL
jgi:hypothetical protein